MTATEFVHKILSAKLWGNLFAMLFVLILLCIGAKLGIDLYTHHGEKIIIPDLKHKLYSDAEHLIEAQGLQLMVSDTGYVKTLPPDCILEQQPKPGHEVKAGRIIYVMINASHARLISMPDIIDNCSYREARAKLTAMGFRVGPPEYIHGEREWVYGAKSKGKLLAYGQKISVDDMIILQVGDGLRDDGDPYQLADPDDYGTNYEDSIARLQEEEQTPLEFIGEEGEKDEFEVVPGT